jgi:hypothetical protein
MKGTGKYVVVVGVVPDTAPLRENQDSAGTNVWGVFTREEAIDFADRVRAKWADQDPASFIYGVPFAEVEQLVANDHPIYDPAASAAGNWFAESEDA